MDELEKMRRGELYDFSSPEVVESFNRCRARQMRFNATTFGTPDHDAALTELVPDRAATAQVVPPFYCDHGVRIRLGEGVFVNTGCTFLDSGGITIGARTLIGPNCQLYTPQHPTDYAERRRPVERGIAIEIGADCWLGGGVVVCPGVRIGDRTIVGAGSVVVHDLPADVMAAGNPAVVKRRLVHGAADEIGTEPEQTDMPQDETAAGRQSAAVATESTAGGAAAISGGTMEKAAGMAAGAAAATTISIPVAAAVSGTTETAVGGAAAATESTAGGAAAAGGAAGPLTEEERRERMEQCAAMLRRHHFEVAVVATAEEAGECMKREIERAAPRTVSFGDSMTMRETGIIEWVRRAEQYELIDGFDPGMPRPERIEERRRGMLADLFITGINAVTQEGTLHWLDMVGNRIAPVAFGPRRVILVAGRNKIVRDRDEAEERIRRIAAPQNIARHPGFTTPCARTGVCMDCNAPDRICNTRMEMMRCHPAGRILVILIDQELGL